MTKTEVKHVQHSMNIFTENHRSLGYTPLQEDGEWGALTKKRIRQIKYDLGYILKNMTTKVDENFYKRMNHPTQVEPAWNQPKETVKRGKKRRAHRRWAVRRNKLKAYLKPGVGMFDGKPVAKCAIPVLKWCRANGWPGYLVSGWRDPVYSRGLCRRMCGRDSCPGTCAGMASNHVGNSPERFAMDLSAYEKFREVVARCPLRPHVHNALPNDRVHFSPSGN